jgi:hypothetical protein
MYSEDLFVCSKAEEACLSELHCCCALPTTLNNSRYEACPFNKSKLVKHQLVETITYLGDTVAFTEHPTK